jgi:hypothetical protein
MILDYVTFLLLLLCVNALRNKANATIRSPELPERRASAKPEVRRVQEDPIPYFSSNDTAILGAPNLTAAIGNPLKGLAGGPRYSQSSPLPNSVPSAIEFYNIGLDEIMIGDNAFNWTLHDQFLSESASRRMHAVLSVYIHWPGRPLRLPPHLLNITLYDTDSGKSPNYGDPLLLAALQQFIVAWGQRIDGDTRLAAIHVGLLGFWGEGHTYPITTLVPESSKQSVAQWYRSSFTRTQIQARYPGPNADGFGLYDGSLAYSTLDGAANGGKNVSWFMYPQMIKANQQDIWKRRITGGETRPELQKIIFTDTYPARTENNQDYKECIDTLHISYALHHDAFQNGGYSGNVLQNANAIHAYMGYAFYVSKIAVYATSQANSETVDVSVDVAQLGVAPFYYDLSLVLNCTGVSHISLPGVEQIILKGESKSFLFRNIPRTKQCCDAISLSLQSSYAYAGRPIRFAQGTNGNVLVSLPLPPVRVVPTLLPVLVEVPAPVAVPVFPPQSPILEPISPVLLLSPMTSGVPVYVPPSTPLQPNPSLPSLPPGIVPVSPPFQPSPTVSTVSPMLLIAPAPVSLPLLPPVQPIPTTPTASPVSMGAPVPVSVPLLPPLQPILPVPTTPIPMAPIMSPVLNVPLPVNVPVLPPLQPIPAPAPVKAPPISPPAAPPVVPNPTLYFTTNSSNILAAPNISAGIGNPLKGLAGGPRYSNTLPLPNKVPSAIEFYNIGLNEIMIGNHLFNWTLHDSFLKGSASRNMHVVLSVYIHWPGQPLRLPPYLLNITLYDTEGGKSPNYGDPRLLTALQQFIVSWGKRTDGDTRLAAIHVGLLGFWGNGYTSPDLTLVPESTKRSVAQWYRDSFKKTQIQTRYPGQNADGFGLYDGSLALSTLDGAANGGKNVSWFMYPQIVSANQQDTWKRRIMGGETASELQKIIFTDTYPARTENRQDYKECIDTLHISYALHHDAFQNGGYSGNVLRNANAIHAYMGYAFYVSEVAAYTTGQSNSQTVDISVAVTQLGVAPFYYDLNLVLDCIGLMKITLPGVEQITLKGQSKSFLFRNVPKTKQCLDAVTVYLQSSYAYKNRPIRFAQGINGKLLFALPLPPAPVQVSVQSDLPPTTTQQGVPDRAPFILQLLNWIFPIY